MFCYLQSIKMKKLQRLFLLISIISFSTTNAQVFICGGEYSERYHASPDCRGLNNCRSEIYEIDEYDAIDMGRTPCQIEYVFEDRSYYSNSNQNYSAQEQQSKWEFLEQGNPIDGLYRRAIAINEGFTKSDGFSINVFNYNESLIMDPSILGEGMSNYEDVKVMMISSKYQTLNDVEKVLFYFDGDNQFYTANFSYNAERKSILIRSAVQSDIKKYVTKSQIINLLKSKNNFHVRLYFNNNGTRDIEFSLKGSSPAINKTVDISKILGNDEAFDLMKGLFALNVMTWENKSYDAFIEKHNLEKEETTFQLVDQIKQRLGDFWYGRVYSSTFENDAITVYDFNGKVILKDLILNIIDVYQGLEKFHKEDKSLDESQKSIIEDVPIFPGCEIFARSDRKACFQEKMDNHIRENFRYPEIAQEMGIQGRVYTQFIIEKDGSITNIKVRGPDINLEREAKRIISLLPKMTPGFQNGKPVRVPYSTPITFRLQ